MAGSTLWHLFLSLFSITCIFGQIKALPTDDAFSFEEDSGLEYLSERDLSKRQTIAQYYTYSVDVNVATFNSLVSSKQTAGNRIVSVSVYGDPSSPLFSVVWSNRPVAGGIPPYVVIQSNVTSSFSSQCGSYQSDGYTASLIAASGPSGQAQFVAVLEKLQSPLTSLLLIGMDGGSDSHSIGSVDSYAYGQKMKMKCVVAYGGPINRLYAAVWVQNTALTKYSAWYSDTPTYYPYRYASETSLPGFRPAWISADTDLSYTSLWTNDRMPTSVPWQHQYGLTKTALINAINTAASSGLAPIMITGGGSTTNSGLLYAVIFGTSDVPAPRVMMTPVGTANTSYIAQSSTVIQSIHTLVQNFMTQYAVRYAQISIKAGGDRRVDYAYAFTEQGNCAPFLCDITPQHKFMLASNSKIFLSAAVQNLVQKGRFNLNQAIFPALGYSKTGSKKPIDDRYLSITIGDCLNHQGGWNTSAHGFDPTYQMQYIALQQRTDGQPANITNIIDYMWEKYPLDYAPGFYEVYSNFGYLALSALVSLKSGLSYWDFLNDDIFPQNNVNLSQIAEVQTSSVNRPPNEIVQESAGVGLSALAPTDPYPVPNIYGGDSMIKEVDTGAADIECSMDLLSGFIHKNAVVGIGGRAADQARDGTTFGAWTFSASNGTEIDWALAFNTRDWMYPQYTDPGDSWADNTPLELCWQISDVIYTTDWGIR